MKEFLFGLKRKYYILIEKGEEVFDEFMDCWEMM